MRAEGEGEGGRGIPRSAARPSRTARSERDAGAARTFLLSHLARRPPRRNSISVNQCNELASVTHLHPPWGDSPSLGDFLRGERSRTALSASERCRWRPALAASSGGKRLRQALAASSGGEQDAGAREGWRPEAEISGSAIVNITAAS